MTKTPTLNAEGALEPARCAYANVNNMVRMMPLLVHHPMLPVVKLQLRTVIELLGDAEFCDLADQDLVRDRALAGLR